MIFFIGAFTRKNAAPLRVPCGMPDFPKVSRLHASRVSYDATGNGTLKINRTCFTSEACGVSVKT